jgi:hypothetical protein
MLAVLELIGLYSEVNQQIIDENLHEISPYFRNVTTELQEVKEKLEKLSIAIPGPGGIKSTSQDVP